LSRIDLGVQGHTIRSRSASAVQRRYSLQLSHIHPVILGKSFDQYLPQVNVAELDR